MMRTEILRNNSLIAGPMDYDAARVRDIVMRQGGDYRLIPNGLINAIHIGTISVLPVRNVKPEITVMQAYGQPERSVTDDAVTYTYPVIERDPAEVLEEQRAAAMMRVNSGYEAEMNEILRQYPQAETLTWDKQEREARAWSADDTALTPYVDAIAEGRDMDKAELVTRIVAKADAWIQASGLATGKRQALEDQISAADSVESLNAIAW